MEISKDQYKRYLKGDKRALKKEKNNLKLGDFNKIVLNTLPPGLNGDKGLRNAHWSMQKKQKETYKKMILACNPLAHIGEVEIVYVRFTTHLMDWDNMVASFKHIGDALHEVGVIQDDNPQIVKRFIPEQVKVSKKKDERVEIYIRDAEGVVTFGKMFEDYIKKIRDLEKEINRLKNK